MKFLRTNRKSELLQQSWRSEPAWEELLGEGEHYMGWSYGCPWKPGNGYPGYGWLGGSLMPNLAWRNGVNRKFTHLGTALVLSPIILYWLKKLVAWKVMHWGVEKGGRKRREIVCLLSIQSSLLPLNVLVATFIAITKFNTKFKGILKNLWKS